MPPQILTKDDDNNDNKSKNNNEPPQLPTSRQVLTSLIDAIAAIPLHNPPPAPTTTTTTTTSPTNALRLVPVAYRHLIVTLHVLFPNLLLPALDVLDRGLVGRVELEDNTPSSHPTSAAGAGTYFYLVRSAGSVQTRRKDGSGGTGGGGGGQYIVRLGAWNCTCAAFAFAAFPVMEETVKAGEGEGEGGDALQQQTERQLPITSTTAATLINDSTDTEQVTSDEQPPLESTSTVPSTSISNNNKQGHEDASQEEKWSFGGLSTDGRTYETNNNSSSNNSNSSSGGIGGAVPVCKHLLACLLAERWSAALGRYIVVRRVGREEMAGIVADV
ncbi:hypothetical protein B0T19DRAFT_265516 [Cercophora scortea]|uniref:SWIM-type domain-containing protein n=1 Tax=Cercophora scortea TaxID=314031 RepID=A0AAE0M6S4_9PEZI|nr:hypothetical protein B0T19DRAFT_265516 [Cercophora scortea]